LLIIVAWFFLTAVYNILYLFALVNEAFAHLLGVHEANIYKNKLMLEIDDFEHILMFFLFWKIVRSRLWALYTGVVLVCMNMITPAPFINTVLVHNYLYNVSTYFTSIANIRVSLFEAWFFYFLFHYILGILALVVLIKVIREKLNIRMAPSLTAK